MSEIKINNIPVITENNGSVSLTTDTANIGNELTTDTANIGNNALVVDAGGNVGVGTSSPGAKLHIVDDDNAGWLYYQYNTGDGANFRNYRARGTIDAPEAILAGDRLASFLAGGYGVTNSSSGFSGPNGGISIHAAENFTNSSAGTYVVLQTSETGTNPAGGGVERMRIDSSGRVTMPYQPAFQVRLSSNQSINANVRTKVAFDTIDYQNGSSYDTTNRRFTAPVTGFYQFNVIVYAYTVANHEVTLWKNGSVYIRSQFSDGASVNPTNGILVVATKLTADDYVEIYSQVTTSATIYNSTERPTTWSGYLIG